MMADMNFPSCTVISLSTVEGGVAAPRYLAIARSISNGTTLGGLT